MLTGKALTAEEAMRAGLVEEVVPSDRFEARRARAGEDSQARLPRRWRGHQTIRRLGAAAAQPRARGESHRRISPAHGRRPRTGGAVEKMEKRRRSRQGRTLMRGRVQNPLLRFRLPPCCSRS